MPTKNRTRTVLTLAAVAMAILGFTGTEANATEAQLLSAISALKDHIDGTTPLNAGQIETHKLTIDANKAIFGDNDTIITACFDLVETYDTIIGPLFVSGSPVQSFSRSSTSDSDINWVVYNVMQNIIDWTYTNSNVSTYQALFDGFKFGSSAFFPGAVNPPADPDLGYDVEINATVPTVWGIPVAYATDPARRPTGFYLAPGSIGKVTVPPSMVNQGFEILVGAHTRDKSNKSNVQRLDRITETFPVTSEITSIANPFGGGIYIIVPYQADLGIVTVQIANAVRSPFFSATSHHQTTLQEWTDTERLHPGPWADFESDKFMMQVPTSWIYNYADPVTQMQSWDMAMDGFSELFGFPLVRNRTVLYVQPDTSIAHGAYGIGYPQINQTYNPDSATNGNSTHFFLTNPIAWSTTYHELGHAHLFSKFPGHTESTVNLPYVYIATEKFGVGLVEAFTDSMKLGYLENISVDQAALTWFVTENFRNGNPMDITNSTKNEVRYQHRGYGRYVDISVLFGWNVISDFYHQESLDYMSGAPGDGLNSVDSRILRLSKAAGVDLTPLIHCWGVHPINATALQDDIIAENLPRSLDIYNRLVHYKDIIPADNAEFWDHYLTIYPSQPEGGNPDYQYGWYNVWKNIYNATHGTAAKNAMQDIIDLYFPFGPPDTGDAEAPTPDPMTFSSFPAATGENSIAMTATEAVDISWVEYYFTCTEGTADGGSDSGWQPSRTYEDTGLSPDTQYTYTVTARDKSAAQNATAASAPASARTNIVDIINPNPDPMTWAIVPNATSSSTILMRATTASDLSGVEYYFICTAGGGNDSGWQDDTYYTDAGLTAGTLFSYTVTARDKSPQQNATAPSVAGSATTLPATADPYIVLSKPVYAPYENIVVHFANAVGNWGDWVGLFHPTTPSTNYNEIQWMYTDGTQSGTDGIYDGTLIFDGLSADSYQARFHFYDGYTIEDTVDFTVLDEDTTPPCYTCGDLNDSGGNVDMADFGLFASCWDENPLTNSSCTCANLVEFDDHIIDLLDLSVITELFLSTSSEYPPNCSTSITDPYPPTPDPMTWALVPTPGSGSGGGTSPVVVLSTDFTGRTVSGNTASNISWTTNGVSDPGDLTAVDINATGDLAGLFDTADTQGHFAPNLNVGNEGPWRATLTLNLTVPEIFMENVVLDYQHFSDTGDFQTANRVVDWTVTIYGSWAGQMARVQMTGTPGTSGTETIVFAAPLALTNSESYEVRILAEGGNGASNNTGLTGLTLNGSVTTTGETDTSIRMIATTATDISGVEYYFAETSGNPSGDDSAWQDSTMYIDTGLTHDTQYTYTVTARDKSTAQNTTDPSTAESATTDPEP